MKSSIPVITVCCMIVQCACGSALAAGLLSAGEADKKNTGGVFTDKSGIRFKLIPAGSFSMGSDDGHSYEAPVHKVTLTKPFYLGITEVTQAQWERVMDNNPSKFKGGNLPVETVSWEDALEFCGRLSKKEGVKYRLPTEAEWEYACRAGTATAYYWGNEADGGYCWYNENSGGRTREVGTAKPNPWGLYDMAGNVWEWCLDFHGDYSAGEMIDPLGPAEGFDRVLRGGSWFISLDYCRSACRDWSGQGYRKEDGGLRVVRETLGRETP